MVILIPNGSGGVASISTTYSVDGTISSAIRADFGSAAPAALRQMEGAAFMAETDANPSIRDLGRLAKDRIAAQRHYDVEADAQVPLQIERAVHDIAEEFYRQTRERLHVTSGSRTPEKQAEAMYVKLELGDDILSLYRNRTAATAIKAAYDAGKAAAKSRLVIQQDMTAVIAQQVAGGVFISRHLDHGAVDIRTREIPADVMQALRVVIASSPTVRGEPIEETTPPHYHLELHPPPLPRRP
ncbi:MAG: hypothetical protein V4617_08190 [Gemmatimonadota bacterium]